MAASVVAFTVEFVAEFSAAWAVLFVRVASDFLFATVAFDCSTATLAAVFDTSFVLGDVVAAPGALAEGFRAAATAFVTVALPVGFTAPAFFAEVFTADPEAAALVVAGFAFFAVAVVVFVGFFIAFAMESTANKGCFARPHAMQMRGRMCSHGSRARKKLMRAYPHTRSIL